MPDQETIKGFIEEVESYFPSLISGIESLKKNPNDQNVINEIYRMIHTITGASSMVEIYGLSAVAGIIENIIESLIDGELHFTDKLSRTLLFCFDKINKYCDIIVNNGKGEENIIADVLIISRRVRGLPKSEDSREVSDLLKSIKFDNTSDSDDISDSENDIEYVEEFLDETGFSEADTEIIEEVIDEEESSKDDTDIFLETAGEEELSETDTDIFEEDTDEVKSLETDTDFFAEDTDEAESLETDTDIFAEDTDGEESSKTDTDIFAEDTDEEESSETDTDIFAEDTDGEESSETDTDILAEDTDEEESSETDTDIFEKDTDEEESSETDIDIFAEDTDEEESSETDTDIFEEDTDEEESSETDTDIFEEDTDEEESSETDTDIFAEDTDEEESSETDTDIFVEETDEEESLETDTDIFAEDTDEEESSETDTDIFAEDTDEEESSETDTDIFAEDTDEEESSETDTDIFAEDTDEVESLETDTDILAEDTDEEESSEIDTDIFAEDTDEEEFSEEDTDIFEEDETDIFADSTDNGNSQEIVMDFLDQPEETEESHEDQNWMDEPSINGESDITNKVDSSPQDSSGGQTSDDDFISELIGNFYLEADTHLDDISNFLSDLEAQIQEPCKLEFEQVETIRRIRRSVHTLKGASGMVQLHDIAKWAHELEDFLDYLYEESKHISPDTIKLLIESSDILANLVSSPEKNNSDRIEELKESFLKIINSSPKDDIDSKEGMSQLFEETDDTDNTDVTDDIDETDETIVPPKIETEDHVFLTARPQKKLIRVEMGHIDEIINLASELIIGLSGCDQEMNTFNRSINELELSQNKLKSIARDIEVGYEVKAIQQQVSKAPALASYSDSSSNDEYEDFDNIELDRYSKFNLLVRSFNESVMDVGTINSQVANVYGDFDGYFNRFRVLLSELQSKMMHIRMTPISFITNRMKRTVREVARDLGKNIKLNIIGENIELDSQVWDKLVDPLMHILRNAVDHGIEAPEVRKKIGKPGTGFIDVSGAREGSQVVIRIKDDGAGINYEKIKEKIKKIIKHEDVEKLTEDEIYSYLFRPGFTTSKKITEISGRGVGLDVVQENVKELKGTIKIISTEGKGTGFTIRIPLTLAVINALLFKISDQEYAIGLNEINEIIRVKSDMVTEFPESTITIKDEILSFHRLSDLLNIPKTETEYKDPVILLIKTDRKMQAIAVDTLVGKREIVVKNLGSHLNYVRGISGATILGDGRIIPIININDIFSSEKSVAQFEEDDFNLKGSYAGALIVDDSISVRLVVARFLEKNGFIVTMANDGLNALEKIREIKVPDIIILDIEMPRMNGYEFLSVLRSQKEYNDIPVIMLSSRTSAKHRNKALSSGADDYVNKPYNEQEFLEKIHKTMDKKKKSL